MATKQLQRITVTGKNEGELQFRIDDNISRGWQLERILAVQDKTSKEYIVPPGKRTPRPKFHALHVAQKHQATMIREYEKPEAGA